ncbi:outer membrane receptor protein involved in Fe transport [Erythromicrobium ramosum]|nr:TonB-dependent receptor [Erythrobacter ramosus]MBB3775242.1 outer membrane receptor protein involved in Fe transport [Erythrobacter ramosus]
MATTAIVCLAQPAAAQERPISVPAGTMQQALDLLARESGTQLIYRSDDIRSLRTKGVKNAPNVEAALKALIADTPLAVRRGADGALVLVRQTAKVSVEVTEPEPASEPIEIVVTGSRIARSAVDSLQPLVVDTKEYIRTRGFQNVGEALRDNPLFTAGLDSRAGRQDEGDVGATFPNLLGLGSNRTLTLIDGKRAVSSASSSAGGINGLQVDVNTIPNVLIERIEVITVGGAPIYGSDAIAGTVNLVLKRDFTGLAVDAQAGLSEQGDAGTQRIGAVFGANFDGGRGNITLTSEYTKQDTLLGSQRPDTSANLLLLSGSGTPTNVLVRNNAFPSLSYFGVPSQLVGLFFPDPTFFVTNASGQAVGFNASGTLQPIPLGVAPADSASPLLSAGIPYDGGQTFRYGDATALRNPSERYTFGALGSYEFSPSLRANIRANYSHVDATAIGDPGDFFDLLTVPTQSPFLAAADRTLIASQIPGSTFNLGRILSDIGSPDLHSEATSRSAVAELAGDLSLGAREFSWNLSYSYGQTDRTVRRRSMIGTNLDRAQDVVIANGNGSGVLIDPLTTNLPAGFSFANFAFDASRGGYINSAGTQLITCRSRATGVDRSCLPFNPFGTTNPAAVRDYITDDAIFRSKIQQQFVQGNIEGFLFDLPGGPVKAGAGFEIRREESRYAVDAASAAGSYVFGSGNLGTPIGIPASANVGGSFTSKEIYAEAVVPLIGPDMDIPLTYKLELEGSARYLDNTVAGRDVIWTAGGRWTVTPGLVVHANATRSVRAPSIAELFSGDQAVTGNIPDVCGRSQFRQNATRQANCISAVIARGVRPDAASALTFLNTFNPSFFPRTGTQSGNPDLDNEIANSWNVGAAISPKLLRGLSGSVDYNVINLKNTIRLSSISSATRLCYDSSDFPNNFNCNLFTRGTNFQTQSGYRTGPVNAGEIRFAAITANLGYQFDLNGIGSFSIGGSGIWNTHFDSSPDGVTLEDNIDTIGAEKFRGRLNLGYDTGNLSLLWTVNYVSSAFLDVNAKSDPDFYEIRRIDSYDTHDLSVAYTINSESDRQFVLRANVQNLFDKDLPLVANGANYDAIGRRFIVGVSTQF